MAFVCCNECSRNLHQNLEPKDHKLLRKGSGSWPSELAMWAYPFG
ncbi:hypothetical protein COLO4_38210 [Corchorus olitorius]|uniref:Uncharacterized protein n=1 Tax=Corchorus olitorius TaxID=93759 RepID=A0A1R3FWE1_9ROSI|nr:hypothetical protein COLO4_38210 [Corchorus olitorius]